MKPILAVISFVLAVTACSRPDAEAGGQEVSAVVLAAVSLTDVLQAAGDLYAAQGHPAPRFNFAGSSALARQLEQGARGDIFISADEAWMDFAVEKSLVDPDTRKTLVTNDLVLIAPASAPFELQMVPGMDLAGALGGGRLALADPGSVPAGKYAREALTHFGAWEAVEPRIARAEDVRAALRFVETGDAAAGIVYATDARAARESVVVVGVFPADSHTPIRYPAAILADRVDGPGTAFLAFLQSDAVRTTLESAGFGIPAQP